MRKILFILVFWGSIGWGQILYTGLNKFSGIVRAYHLIQENEQIIELSYGNSYLPRWLNENFIVLNIGNSIFKVDKYGESKTYFFEGYMPVVSRSGKFIAAYTEGGITVADSSGRIISKIEVECWKKVTPLFSYDEKSIYYYDNVRNGCFKFDFEKQTNTLLGHFVFHPLYSPDGKKLIFNVGKTDSNFRVAIADIDWKENQQLHYITSEFENSIVPIWSPSGRYIAYMKLLIDKTLPESDLIPAIIVLYDNQTQTKTIVTEDAGFTEGVFPQFSFSKDERYIYYTCLRDDGTGTIAEIDLHRNQKRILISDKSIDARVPISLGY